MLCISGMGLFLSMFARSMASLLSARIVLPGHFEALLGLRSSLQDAGGDKHKGPQFLCGSAACRVSMLLFAFGNDSVSYRITASKKLHLEISAAKDHHISKK